MEQKKSTRGGWRGGGRPKTNRTVALGIRISPEAAEVLSERTTNKNEFIDNLLLNLPGNINAHGLTDGNE